MILYTEIKTERFHLAGSGYVYAQPLAFSTKKMKTRTLKFYRKNKRASDMQQVALVYISTFKITLVLASPIDTEKRLMPVEKCLVRSSRFTRAIAR